MSLPFPWPETTNFGLPQFEQYITARREHLAAHPHYDDAWNRPSSTTSYKVAAAKVAAALGIDIDSLLPGWARRVAPDYRKWLDANVATALTIGVGFIVDKARRGEPDEPAALPSAADFQSELFVAFSDTVRAARVSGWDLTEAHAKAARRDLLAHGINVGHVWQMLVSISQSMKSKTIFDLYEVSVHWKLSKAVGRWTRRYRVRLIDGPVLDAVEAALAADPYQLPEGQKLLLPGEPIPARRARARVAAEYRHQVVPSGPRTTAALDALEKVTLGFDLSAFRRDIAKLKTRRQELRTLKTARSLTLAERKELDRVTSMLQGFRAVEAQTQSWPASVIDIRAPYSQVVNRRLQHGAFWPPAVTAKGEEVDHDLGTEVSTMRARWFVGVVPSDFPNVRRYESMEGVDIKASMWQLIATAVGARKLEAMLADDDSPWWDRLAARAWKNARSPRLSNVQAVSRAARRAAGEWVPDLGFRKNVPGVDDYTGPADPRLKLAVKLLLTPLVYGSTPENALAAVREKAHVAGPGWAHVAGVNSFLTRVPGYKRVQEYLTVARAVAALSRIVEGECGPMKWTDPIDGQSFEWAPIARKTKVLNSNGFKSSLSLPAKYIYTNLKSCPGCGYTPEDWTRKSSARFAMLGLEGPKGPKPLGECPKSERPDRWFVHKRWHVQQVDFILSEPDAQGRYPVDERALQRMAAPCTVHNLDTLFNVGVIEGLVEAGVESFVVIHDSWLLPAPQAHLLADVVEKTGQEFLKRMGTIYDSFAYYADPSKFMPAPDDLPEVITFKALTVAHVTRLRAKIEMWRRRWARRVEREDWPVFATSEVTPLQFVEHRDGTLAVPARPRRPVRRRKARTSVEAFLRVLRKGKSYHALAMRWHPDRQPPVRREVYTVAMQNLNTAYTIYKKESRA